MTVNCRQAAGLMASLGVVAQCGPSRAAGRFETPNALADAAGKEGEMYRLQRHFPGTETESDKSVPTTFSDGEGELRARLLRAMDLCKPEYGSGISKTARHPNAARLYLDWILSDEGQAMAIRDQGNMKSLNSPPLAPHDKWLEEWNKIYGYRQ